MKELKKQISGLIYRSHAKRWAIFYVFLFLFATIVVLSFFGNQQYSSEQVAIIISIPFTIVFILFYISAKLIVIPEYPDMELQDADKITIKVEREDATKNKLSTILDVGLAVLIVVGVMAFFFAIILTISSSIYLLLGLTGVSNFVWFHICIPSFITAAGCLCLLMLAVVIAIMWTYRHKIISLFQQQLPSWEADSNEFRINGLKIPVHVPKILL